MSLVDRLHHRGKIVGHEGRDGAELHQRKLGGLHPDEDPADVRDALADRGQRRVGFVELTAVRSFQLTVNLLPLLGEALVHLGLEVGLDASDPGDRRGMARGDGEIDGFGCCARAGAPASVAPTATAPRRTFVSLDMVSSFVG
jgi:hypothetical protein